MEGADAIVSSISHISLLTVGAIMYLAYLSTFVGYTLWSRLLGRYETGVSRPICFAGAVCRDCQQCAAAGETITMMQFAGLGFYYGGPDSDGIRQTSGDTADPQKSGLKRINSQSAPGFTGRQDL